MACRGQTVDTHRRPTGVPKQDSCRQAGRGANQSQGGTLLKQQPWLALADLHRGSSGKDDKSPHKQVLCCDCTHDTKGEKQDSAMQLSQHALLALTGHSLGWGVAILTQN